MVTRFVRSPGIPRVKSRSKRSFGQQQEVFFLKHSVHYPKNMFYAESKEEVPKFLCIVMLPVQGEV
eukprot:11803680-Prorocentrum_lima.AAC.1